MKVVARYTNSIGRLGNGDPLTETLYAVVQSETGMYCLFEGEPEHFSVSSERCLDVCSAKYWKDLCEESIQKWLSFHLLSVEEEVSSIQEELTQLHESLKGATQVRRRLIEARIK
ncbi:hypothetical protein VP501E541_P0243 [Vibrio phage 501E54-1]|nr:hypothetical protein VP501E541_P0243 [Vibrio phage 501E54-1]